MHPEAKLDENGITVDSWNGWHMIRREAYWKLKAELERLRPNWQAEPAAEMRRYQKKAERFEKERDAALRRAEVLSVEAQRLVDVIEQRGPCKDDKHELDPDFADDVSCMTPYCSGSEYRCLKCGWYDADCGCHSSAGRRPSQVLEPTRWKTDG